MTWTRLTDNFVEDLAFEGLLPEARWHYLCLVQYCSRTSRYDGCVTRYNARYVSGSEPSSPDEVVASLVEAGLLAESADGKTVVVVRIDEHVPPPHMRDEQRKSATKLRVQRHRERKRTGQSAESVTEVTRYTGTGRDRSGQENRTTNQTSNSVTENGHQPVADLSRAVTLEESWPCEFCGARGPTKLDEFERWVCVGRCDQAVV